MGLDKKITCTKGLLSVLERGITAYGDKKIQDLVERIRGLLDTDRIQEIRSKDGEDARFGRKTPMNTFYGYKNHLVMAEERLITGINITPGREPDGQQLPGLVEKAQGSGTEIMGVIGDVTYVNEDNVDTCGEEITLIAKINPVTAAATGAKLEEGFSFSKDAEMLQYPVGELAVRVERREARSENQYRNYVFNKKKREKCPLEGQCKIGRWKTYNYSIIQTREKNRNKLELEASEELQERLRIRHRIGEKNRKSKEAHGLGRADSMELFVMELQVNFTMFAANVKRIAELIALAG